MVPILYFVGIDLHKEIIQICVLSASGEIVKELRFRFSTLEEGLAVVEDLVEWKAGGRFVVEAIGMNRWFVNACRERGLDVVVANPGKLGLRKSGKKTDRRDAYELARRLWLGDIDQNARTYYPTGEEYGTRKLLRTRHKLVSLRQQVVNQIRGLLNAYLISAPKGVLYTGRSLVALDGCALPTENMNVSFGALLSSLRGTQASIKTLARQIEVEAKKDPKTVALMETIPSLGPVTALTVRYELGDVTRFRSAKEICSYAGLVPRVANSADTAHHGPLTKQGSRELRWVLNEWAVRMLSRNLRVKAWAAPRLKRMHKNKLRIALARKLLVGMYMVFTRGEEFYLEKCLAA
jgi:transposase